MIRYEEFGRCRNRVTFSCQVSLLDFLWLLPLQCLHLPEQGSGKVIFYSVITESIHTF